MCDAETTPTLVDFLVTTMRKLFKIIKRRKERIPPISNAES